MDGHYDLMVIGGGITGLSLAHQYAHAGRRVGVLEAEPRLGGCIHTGRFAMEGEEFWLELGAHTLFNSYRNLLALFPQLDLHQSLLNRERLPYRLYQEQRLRSIPGALRWGELLRHLPKAMIAGRAGQRVVDFFSAVAGPRNYAEVIGPALDGLLCQPAGEFPAGVVLKKRERDSSYPRTFSLKGGLSTLAERLAATLDVHTACAVRTIERSDGAYGCATEKGTLTAERLALAVPPVEAARLLEAIEPEIAHRLAQIPMATVDATGVVLRREEAPLMPLAGLVARDAPFYSVVSRDVIPDPRWRGFTFHFGERLTEAERLATAAKVLDTGADRFVAVAHARHVLPGLRLGHGARMEAIDDLLLDRPLALAGNYFGGLSIEDCVTRATREAARLLGMTAH